MSLPHVPHAAIGLIGELFGKCGVDRAPLGEASGLVDRGAHQGVTETELRAPDLDQAGDNRCFQSSSRPCR